MTPEPKRKRVPHRILCLFLVLTCRMEATSSVEISHPAAGVSTDTADEMALLVGEFLAAQASASSNNNKHFAERLLLSRRRVADDDGGPPLPTTEEIDTLLAAEARRVAGEDIVIVGNGTVNIDPREFLLRQFPHLARRLFGSAFALNVSSTTAASTSTSTSTTERTSTPAGITNNQQQPSPQITTKKPEIKLSQQLPNSSGKSSAATTAKKKETNKSAPSPPVDETSQEQRARFSMIIPDLSDSGKGGPRPSRITLSPFGSRFLPEFSSHEEPKKKKDSKQPNQLEPTVDDPYDDPSRQLGTVRNFANPASSSPPGDGDGGDSPSPASIVESTRFPPSPSSHRPYEQPRDRQPFAASTTTTTTTARPPPSAVVTLESAATAGYLRSPSTTTTTAAVASIRNSLHARSASSTVTPSSSATEGAIDGAPCNVTEVTYATLKDGLEMGDYLMIDVRPKEETAITGVIPGSVNIPGSRLLSELDLDEYRFERRHRYVKPDPKTGPRLVLTGRNESDVVNVVRQLQSAGFDHLLVYPRGILDWIVHGGRIEKIEKTVDSGLSESSEEDADGDGDGDGDGRDAGNGGASRRVDVWGSNEDEFLTAFESSRSPSSRKVVRPSGFGRLDEKEIDYLDYEELKHVMKAKETLLIDVRRREAFRRGSVPGAFNLPLHLITFDAPMTPARFKQKHGFTLPSKLALGNVVVFGRDRYDGIGAVRRFRVVGYKMCQVYVGYDDWKKNAADEAAAAAAASGDQSGRESSTLGAAAVASDLNFVTRPPPAGSSKSSPSRPYPTTTPDPRLLFRSTSADVSDPPLPGQLSLDDVQIIVAAPDADRLQRVVRNLRQVGYKYVTMLVVQPTSTSVRTGWRPLSSGHLRACFSSPSPFGNNNNVSPVGAGSGPLPAVVAAVDGRKTSSASNSLTSVGGNDDKKRHQQQDQAAKSGAANNTYRRTPGFKSSTDARFPGGRSTANSAELNFQRPQEDLARLQNDDVTSPGDGDGIDGNGDGHSGNGGGSDSHPPGSNRLKIVKEEIFFKDLLEKMQKGEFKVFEFRNEDSVRKDGKIPRSALLKLWEIPGVLTMQDQEFHAKFGFRKPQIDGSDVVVSCDDPQVGREAVRRMRQLGYTRAALFSGCFPQWKALGGPVEYPTPSRIAPGELALQVRKGAVIIDVGDLKLEGREPFPKSINIPVSDLRPAFHLNDREFQQKFGYQKFDKDTGKPLILTAANPQMVHDASNVLASLGYHNVRLLYMDL